MELGLRIIGGKMAGCASPAPSLHLLTVYLLKEFREAFVSKISFSAIKKSISFFVLCEYNNYCVVTD